MSVADLQILVEKLQTKINQLELLNKGAINATEFRLEAILQANLDTFLVINMRNLSFLNASRLYVFRVWFIKK